MSIIIVSVGYIIFWISIAVFLLWAAASIAVYILERTNR